MSKSFHWKLASQPLDWVVEEISVELLEEVPKETVVGVESSVA